MAAEALEAGLSAACDEAHSAWPEVELADAPFVTYLGEHIAGDVDPVAELQRMQLSDLYLACACVHGLRSAIAAFERYCFGAIAKALARLGQPPAFVDEVRQLVRTKLLVSDGGAAPRISQYAGRGSLPGWTSVVAQRVAQSLLRRAAAPSPLVSDEVIGSDPELVYLDERYRADFRAAVSAAIAALPARDRVLLRLYFVDGISQVRIGAMYGVAQSTAMRRIARARETILHDTERILRERLRLDASEFESLAVRMALSLDLSITRLLSDDLGGLREG